MSGLYLSELILSHYRSHHHLSLELDARPVALFGSNGAGKTNILEAISMLSPGRGLRRAAMDMRRVFQPLNYKAKSNFQLADLQAITGLGFPANGRNAPSTLRLHRANAATR